METIVIVYAIKSRAQVTIENTYHGEKDIWAIRAIGSRCLNKEAKQWEHEPIPSDRTEEFFKKCRFSLDEANLMFDTDEVKKLIAAEPELA